MIYHNHYIIPKHMGGSDHKSNIVKLTVEEHAEAHRILYEEHNRWQDYIAWKALSGQISVAEAIKETQRLANLGKKHTEETKEKIRKARAKQVITEETKQKMSAVRKRIKIDWDTKSTTPEANLKRSMTMSGKKKPLVRCPHCGKEGGHPTMKQWHFDNCKDKI